MGFLGAESFLDLPRHLGIASAEVDSCGETVGLLLAVLKAIDEGAEGFPLFLSGSAKFTLCPEVDWSFDCEDFFVRVTLSEYPSGSSVVRGDLP